MQRNSVSAENGVVEGGKDFILDYVINIPNSETKTLKDMSSKDIYNVFNLSNPPIIPSHNYWSEKFDNDDINWDSWYEVNIINKYSPRPCKSFNFRVLHGEVNTESVLKHFRHANGQHYSDGICLMCHPNRHADTSSQSSTSSGIEESLEHLLFYCPDSRKIWKIIQSLL